MAKGSHKQNEKMNSKLGEQICQDSWQDKELISSSYKLLRKR